MRLPSRGPRAVKIRPEFLTNILIAEAVLAGLLILAYTVYGRPHVTDHEIKTRGSPVQGVAITKRVKDAPRDPDARYELPYRYAVNGKEYAGKSEVTLERFFTTPVDAPVTVWYLPEHPEISALSGAVERRDGARDTRFVLIGIAGAIGLVTLCFRFSAQRERRMLREWEAVPVKVEEICEQTFGGYREVEIRFAGTVEGEPREWRIAAISERPMVVGTETILLQNLDQPKQFRLVDDLKYVESEKADA